MQRSGSSLHDYHLLNTFDDVYVLFEWSSNEYDHSIYTLPNGIQLPQLDQGLQILLSLETVYGCFRLVDLSLLSVDESLTRPMLCVHVSLFVATTILAISMLHMLSNRMDLADIVKAWVAFMSRNQAAPRISFDTDVLQKYKEGHPNYPFTKRGRKGWQ